MNIYFYTRLGLTTLLRGFSYAQSLDLHRFDRTLHARRQPLQQPLDVICTFGARMIIVRHYLVGVVNWHLRMPRAISA